MRNNEFFRALNKKENLTRGENNALSAWCNGIREQLDFPFLMDTMWEEEVADFLKSIKSAGFKKFGFFGMSTMAIRNIVAFTKAGWKLTDTFEFDEDRHYEGLIFES